MICTWMVPYLELIRIEIFKDVSKLWQDGLGVVQKLRGQDEVGRWSKNAYFCPRKG